MHTVVIFRHLTILVLITYYNDLTILANKIAFRLIRWRKYLKLKKAPLSDLNDSIAISVGFLVSNMVFRTLMTSLL